MKTCNVGTPQSKKVAFVATVYWHLEAFHLPSIALLQEMGYEVHAYGRPDHGKKGLVDQGVICHDIEFDRNPFKFKNIRALLSLTASFKKEQFTIIHVHTPVASILARIAGKIAGVSRVIYTAHGFHFYKGAPCLNWLIYYPAERIVSRWTDFLITINEEDYSRASGFPVRNEVLYVPGVGVDTGRFNLSGNPLVRNNKRQELGLLPNEAAVFCVAELITRKNQIQLIKAVQQLAELKKGVRCFLVGNGTEEQVLRNYVEKHGLNKHVHFLGFRRDIPELLAASDIVALVSKHEGLTKALMEGMAAGKPIITSDVRGNRELVIDGETGFLVPLNDVNATVKAILKLVNDSELRNKMGYRNLQLAEQFDYKVILSEMKKIYNRVLLQDLN